MLISYDSVLIFLAPVAGSLVNKFSCRSVSIAGSLIGFLGFTLSTLSTNIKVLSLTYGVIGGKPSGIALNSRHRLNFTLIVLLDRSLSGPW